MYNLPMRELWRRHTLALAVTTAVSISLLLYGPTLRLPIIYDSLLHIRIAKALNLLSVWLPTEAFGFYRPLTFFPILLIKALFGYYPAWLFHGLNVAQHALNGALLVWLVWRLWGNGRLALLTGLIFAVYPFSYQAVAVYGHNVHPTIANFMLLGLHCVLSGLRTGKRWWWWATAVFAILSLLTHESGLLLGAFAFLLQWNAQGQWPLHRAAWRAPWFWLLLLGVAYFVLYRFLPIERAPQTDAAGALNLAQSGWYLLQGGAFPTAWFAPLWPGDGRLLILAGLLLLGIGTGWLLRQKGAALALAWGWWGLAAALIGLALPTNYLLHGPRLLYLASVGVALLWALLLDEAMGRKWGRWAATAVFLFIVLSSAHFVWQRLQDYARLTAPVTAVAAQMADRPAHEAILLVNLPQWLAQPQNRYAVGVEFVAMLGDYLFVEELIGENLRPSHPVQAVVVPELRRAVNYPHGLHAQTPVAALAWLPSQHVFIVDYLPTGPQARYTGLANVPAPDAPLLATLGPYELLQLTCTPAGQLQTTWRIHSPVPPTTSLFVQGLDGAGRLVTQADGPPLGLPPELLPKPPFTLVDVRQLPQQVSQHLPEGETAVATLLLGAYDYLSGARYAAYDADGRALPEEALRVSWSFVCGGGSK